ncbi:MAG: histidine phosphatase family protein [Alphaproteobacteria bacterium]|nr:MAG: histidine phosphatase family protein [Alphaproteobacteria bacterium]
MILVRHGQSHFNVVYNATRRDPGIIDPGLTDEGRRQAEAAALALRAHGAARRILASPYTRTLHTAQIIAARLGLPVTVEPLVRERAYFACDIGSPRSELMARWPEFDFGDLPERWWPDPEETEAELHQRCRTFRARMAARDDWAGTVVVSHWGFIRGLTGLAVANGEMVPFRPHD